MTSKHQLVPKLRFPGFSQAWQTTNLGQYLALPLQEKVAVKSISQLLSLRLHLKGLTLCTDSQLRLGATQYYRRKAGQLIYGKQNYLNQAIAIIPPEFDGKCTSKDIPSFEVKAGDANFLYFSISRKSYIQSKAMYAKGSGSKRISEKAVLSFAINAPEEAEQRRLGSFFQELTKQIKQIEQTKEQVEQLKLALLPKMLGADAPLRFPGFTLPWQATTLGQEASITTGKLNAEAMQANGKYDFYTSGMKKFKINSYAFTGPAITIAGNGSTVGYMFLADGKFNAYQRTYVLQNFKTQRLFTFYAIKLPLKEKIAIEFRGGSIPYIVIDVLTQLIFYKPQEVAEQEKVGNFFAQVDALLAHYEQLLGQYEELKQALLQQMLL